MSRLSVLILALGLAASTAMPAFASSKLKSNFLKFRTVGGDHHPKIAGTLIDHTRNHGADCRIWSRQLWQKRDLYVYLPPGYDESYEYPVVLFLHPFAQDERVFLHIVGSIDQAISSGKFPPCIFAAPDGSMNGDCSCERPGSFFVNSNAGSFEDYLLQDVWDFLAHNYSIRCEREAHALAGVSMGGHAAFNLGIRHRQMFAIAAGVHPPLNLRWCDVDGNPRVNFDPRRWGWRQGFDHPQEPLARFGLTAIRMGDVIRPVFGEGEEAVINVAANNPIELIDRCKLRNGELSMFVAYCGHDEFNIDAQVESFLYLAKCRGLGVTVAYNADGRHDAHSAMRFLPTVLNWLGPQLAPYAPPLNTKNHVEVVP